MIPYGRAGRRIRSRPSRSPAQDGWRASPNGAGKTTTIRLLLDLIRPTAGQARVLGLDTRRDGVEVRRRVGYLPGDLALYEDLTAARQLAFLARLRGRPELDPRPLAERLALDLHRPVKALSRGNKQKVGLGQAFMHDPELLILDEPTTGLDPLIQHEFAAMVGEARERGRTVFLSSHVLGDVERLADRVGLLRAGRLVLVDDVGALKARVTRRIELHLAEAPPPAAFADVPGVEAFEQAGDRVTLTLAGRLAVRLVRERRRACRPPLARARRAADRDRARARRRGRRRARAPRPADLKAWPCPSPRRLSTDSPRAFRGRWSCARRMPRGCC